jgi:hypothetical protein
MSLFSGILIVQEFWMPIYFSNQVFFENSRIVYYIFQKDISNNQNSFDPCFQGVCGWESNWEFDSYLLF